LKKTEQHLLQPRRDIEVFWCTFALLMTNLMATAVTMPESQTGEPVSPCLATWKPLSNELVFPLKFFSFEAFKLSKSPDGRLQKAGLNLLRPALITNPGHSSRYFFNLFILT
jgi:hypothetical protein